MTCLALAVVLGACALEPPAVPDLARLEIGEPSGPPPPRLTVVPGALPPGARAQLPAFDGDAFYVALPAQGVPAPLPRVVLSLYVAPLLAALGTAPSAVTLAEPTRALEQPAADVAALLAFTGARAGQKDLTAAAVERAEARRPGTLLPDLGRVDAQLVFPQLVHGTPLEQAGVIAAGPSGGALTSLRGAVLSRWTVVNAPALDAARATSAAGRALERLVGDGVPVRRETRVPVTRVLLRHGRDAAGIAQLRYAWRLALLARFRAVTAPVLVWVDAADGTLLRARPLVAQVEAHGRAWSRDAGGPTYLATFEIDPAAGNRYVLKLAGVFARLDHRGDGYNAKDVKISSKTHGSSATVARFDQPSIDDPATSVCAGGDVKFQQVSAFAVLAAARDRVVASGIYTPYPLYPLNVFVEQRTGTAPGSHAICGSYSTHDSLLFGACDGYYAPTCPAHVNASDDQAAQLNHAHDATVLLHELGHNVTLRLMTLRPPDWCGSVAACPTVREWGAFHDLADFWAAHLAGTNCIGGWVGKNAGGAVDASRDCARHDEDSGIPRLLHVDGALDPANPADHFPEKTIARRAAGLVCSDYCRGQIAGAALWQARAGIERRFPLVGIEEFGVRLQSALRHTGMDVVPLPYTDTTIYRLLHELALELTREWATSASATATNKIVAGFARAGAFLLPYACLGAAGAAAPACPNGGSAGDAIVDVDRDFVAAGGPPPLFNVWTGPRYRLGLPSGQASITATPPCHAAFLVEISKDPAFPSAATASSGWTPIPSTPLSDGAPACTATWTPTAAQWSSLGLAAGSSVYYRATTRNAADSQLKISTAPGDLFTVPPPFVVLTAADATPR